MQQKTLLLVEDNPDDEALTIRALKKHNLANEIVVARDGQEALDYLFAEGDYRERDMYQLPQVILLDLKLPKLDGLDVLERIRKNPITEHVPVVVLTSSNEQQDKVQSYNLGANSYVRKPVDFEQFIEAARQLGLFWLVLNEVPYG
ncbi:MAG: response regulator [Gammaproteobacteria bacterium]|nr:response regulator [Gammaproteobacteria bacterium]